MRTYVEKNRFHWDLDSSIKQAGIRHINFMSLHFAEKSHFPESQMRSLLQSQTTSSCDPSHHDHDHLMIVSTVANLNGSILLTPSMKNCWDDICEEQLDKLHLRDAQYICCILLRFRPPIPRKTAGIVPFSGTKAEKLSLRHLLRPRALRRTLQHMDLIT